jgi:HAE1 family hydrophobic/amphiphilic exporter-1
MQLDESTVPINISLQKKDMASSRDLLAMGLYNEMGQLIRLNQFARVQDELSSAQLERTNRTPSVTIKSQVIGRTGGQVNNEFKNIIEERAFPDDVYFIFGGQTKRTQDGLRTMIFAFAASILLVYFVLVILYNSFAYPLVILFSIPMAMIGALLALALTMEALSIFSILGLVMLVGLVGKNAILVVDFANRLRSEGLEVKEALVKATQLRFRPVLMTNLSMIIGLIPIAIASGAGSEWKNGLAWVIIGGLSSSMLLTLIIVPVIYSLFASSMKKVTVTTH